MPKKTGHNCSQCSKLSNAEAQAKPCWDAERCPNRRHYQRNKGRISQQRKFNRSAQVASDSSINPRHQPRTIEIDPPLVSPLALSSIESDEMHQFTQ